jgi:hypothetical protein
LLCTLLGFAACGPKNGGAPATEKAAAQPRLEVDIFALGRVLGTLAPCGCTTEPLGGLQYLFGFLEANTNAAARLVITPGSFLFPDTDGPEAPKDEAAWAQAEQRARVLQARFSGLGASLVAGIGPFDLPAPEAKARRLEMAVPRVLANGHVKAPAPAGSTRAAEIPPHRIVRLASGDRTIAVGITAAIDPAHPRAGKLGPLTPVEPAVRQQVDAMRAAGAEVTIAVVQGPRQLAESVAQATSGLDIVLAGMVAGVERARVGTPATLVGGTFVIEPGEQMQTVTHLRLAIEPGTAAIPPASDWTLRTPKSVLKRELSRVKERLAKFRADPNADPSFVARLEQEQKRLEQEIEQGATPKTPVTAVFEQVKITCRGARDADATAQLAEYDRWVADQNRKRFAGVRPPKPKRGEPGYSGVDKCEMCHEEAVQSWRQTAHASAYETLEKVNKQFDLSCVGCHVTGFRRPGGSEVVENEGLRDVQCEVCHGPGSIHNKTETIESISREVGVEICLECHTAEHSDTFDFEPYLRDVVGRGHGREFREKLGDGPTGAKLREAKIKEAGGACKGG